MNFDKYHSINEVFHFSGNVERKSAFSDTLNDDFYDLVLVPKINFKFSLSIDVMLFYCKIVDGCRR